MAQDNICRNPETPSFFGLTEEEISTHCRTKKYGDFTLTGAVAPSYDLVIVPENGFRQKPTVCCCCGCTIPFITISASKEILFDLFLDLVSALNSVVDVVIILYENHNKKSCGRRRDDIDIATLLSILQEFEENLLGDGCLEVAVAREIPPVEIQLDDHKLIQIWHYQHIPNFIELMTKYGLKEKPEMYFITEAEHVHSSSEDSEKKFYELASRLSAGEI